MTSFSTNKQQTSSSPQFNILKFLFSHLFSFWMKGYICIKVSLLLSEIDIRKLQWVFLTNTHIVRRAWHIMSCTPFFMFANVTQTQTWYQRSHHILMQNRCLCIRITFDPSLGGFTICWQDQGQSETMKGTIRFGENPSKCKNNHSHM
jgi:hypothetical protein